MTDFYKVQVRIGWKNQLNGTENKFEAGDIISFEEGDFHPKALQSLEDTLARGLVVPLDPDRIGDVDYMSKDEMLNFLRERGHEDLAHNETHESLVPLVEAELAKERQEEESND